MSKRRAGLRADVEGLRGIAVLAVVLYHARVPTLSGGYVGVDVFYVLSGFLITGLLWDELTRTRRISLGAFYARRARRLLPSSILVLLVTVGASYAVLSPLRAQDVMRDAMAAALYVANYRFALLQTDYLSGSSGPSPLQHYWSLGVEEQYYLVWPLLLLALRAAFGRGRRAVSRPIPTALVLTVVTALSFALSIHVTRTNQPWAFFSLPTRAWELGVGGVLALVASQLRRLSAPVAALLGWAGLTVLVGSTFVLDDATPFPGTMALLPVLGTAAVLAAGSAGGRAGPQWLLAVRPLQWAGRVSYAWYLWHWPVLVLAAAAAGHPLGLVTRLGLVVLSAVLAALTVRLVEQPVRFAPRLTGSTRRSLGLAAALTAVAVAAPVAVQAALSTHQSSGAVVATAALPLAGPRTTGRRVVATHLVASPLLTAVEGAVAQGVTTTALPRNLVPSLERAHRDKAAPFVDGCNLTWTATRQGTCSYGRATAPFRVVLLGDSHAAQWLPGLQVAAQARNWQVQSWTKATCPPLEMDVWSPVLHRPYRECAQWRAAMLSRIRADPPDVVVLGVARHYGPEYRFRVYSPAWVDGLRAMVRELRAAGTRVVVMGPTPHPVGDVPDCLSAHPDDARRCTQPRASAVSDAGMAAERAAVESASGRYVDVSPWICTRLTCAVVVGNLLVYRDDNHLTTEYPQWLAPLLASEIQPRG